MNVRIAFYSSSGHVRRMARAAAEVVQQAPARTAIRIVSRFFIAPIVQE